MHLPKLEYLLYPSLVACAFIAIALSVAWALDRLNYLPHLRVVGPRYAFLDGLRGFAAFFVFVNHAPTALHNMGIENPNIRLPIFYGNLGSLGVQIFFCITGFLFFDRIIKTDGKIDWRTFYVSRIARIVPLYAFLIALTTAIAIAAGGKIEASDDNLKSISSLLTFSLSYGAEYLFGFKLYQITGATWTLIHEWRFYLVLPFIAMLYQRPAIGRFVLCAATAIAAIDFSVSSIVVWTYFATGIAAAWLYNKRINFPVWVRLVAGAAAIALFMLVCGEGDGKGYGWGRYLIVSGLFFSVMLADPKPLRARAVMYLGEISYSIYLLHMLVLYLAVTALGHFRQLESVGQDKFMIFLCGCAALVVLLASATYRFIEFPFLKNASKKSAQRVNASANA